MNRATGLTLGRFCIKILAVKAKSVRVAQLARA